MLNTVRHSGGLAVELRYAVWAQRLTLMTAWLAFSPIDAGQKTTGRWLHRRCLDIRVKALFGTAALTLMRARDEFE
jgi:hypothetical protein